MDFFDLLQERDIRELREQFDHLRLERDLDKSDTRRLMELAEENLEVKLRLAVLVRLLIAKGVITAAEYAELIAQARARP